MSTVDVMFKNLELIVDVDYYPDEHWLTINDVWLDDTNITAIVKGLVKQELIKECLKKFQ